MQSSKKILYLCITFKYVMAGNNIILPQIIK